MSELTELLGRVQAGESDARDALFGLAYAELHRLARSPLRDGGRNTLLDTTCLVHEAYLRFVSAGQPRAEDRRAFLLRRCATSAVTASRRLRKPSRSAAPCNVTEKRRR